MEEWVCGDADSKLHNQGCFPERGAELNASFNMDSTHINAK